MKSSRLDKHHLHKSAPQGHKTNSWDANRYPKEASKLMPKHLISPSCRSFVLMEPSFTKVFFAKFNHRSQMKTVKIPIINFVNFPIIFVFPPLRFPLKIIEKLQPRRQCGRNRAIFAVYDWRTLHKTLIVFSIVDQFRSSGRKYSGKNPLIKH